MDINSLLSPSETPARESTPPVPSSKSASPKGGRKKKEASTVRQSPLLQTLVPPISPSRYVAMQQRPEMPSPPGSNFSSTTAQSGFSQPSYQHNMSKPSIERPPLGRAPTSGMDTLAELASMQHPQQTARLHPGRQNSLTQAVQNIRPSLQSFQRQTSGSRGSIDMSMLDAPKPKALPRALKSVSLTEAELKEASQLFEHLADNSHAYEAHLRLTRLLRKGLRTHSLDPVTNEIRQDPRTYELVQELQEANNSMGARFAIGEDLWLERLQDQQVLAHNAEECLSVIELCQKAVSEEAGSTALWQLFGNWVHMLYLASHDVEGNMPAAFRNRWAAWSEEDRMVAREVFQRQLVLDTWRQGAQETMYNINDSHLIWDKYLMLLVEDLDKAPSRPGVTSLGEIFERRLKTPHKTWDQTFQQFSSFVSRFLDPATYEQTMVRVNQTSRIAKTRYEARDLYELTWQQARDAGDQAIEMTIVIEYLEWELGQSRKKKAFSFDLSKALYQRALLRFPLHTVLWEELFLFLAEELPDGQRAQQMLPAMVRGTSHCPWSGTLWAHYIRAGELENLSFEEMSQIKHRATSKGLLDSSPIEDHFIISANWCSYLRRHAFNGSSLHEDELDVTEVGIRSALEEMEVLGRHRHGEGYQGDPQFRLERIYIRFCTQVGDGIHLQTARDTWRKLIPRRGHTYEFWQCYFLWEMYIWIKHPRDPISPSAKAATAVLMEGLTNPNLDWPEKLINDLLKHSEDYEDPAGQLSSIIATRKARKDIERKRAKERAEAEQFALHQQQVEQIEALTMQEPDVALASGKRKREEAEEVHEKKYKKTKSTDADENTHMTDQHNSKLSQVKRDRENATVIVKNLPPGITERRVRHYFRDCGDINSIKVIASKEGESSEAVIEFDNSEDVLVAQTRDMKEIDGRPIEVHIGTGTSIYVANYPAGADEAYIRSLFAEFGEIIDVRFPSLKYNTHRRFCYVQFRTSSQAKVATKLDGTRIQVDGQDLPLVAKVSDPSRKQHRSGALEEGREVYASNLDWSVAEDELKAIFAKYGTVERVRIPKNMAGKSKGMAFVTFMDVESAKAALDLDNTKLKSRIISVSPAVADRAKRNATTLIRGRSTVSPSPSSGGNVHSPAVQAGGEITSSGAATREDITGRTIALLDVPDTVNDARIRAICEPHGVLSKIVLRPDHSGAIVEYADVASAGKASLALDGFEIVPGRTISVGIVPELMGAKAEKKDQMRYGGKTMHKSGGVDTKIVPSAGLGSGVIRRPGQYSGRRGGLGIKRGGVARDSDRVVESKPSDRDKAVNGMDVDAKDWTAKGPEGNVEPTVAKSNAEFKAMFF